MMYTVRYTKAGDGPRTESVEANGPSEAVIKFRAVYPSCSNGARREVVTSVSPEIPICESDCEDEDM